MATGVTAPIYPQQTAPEIPLQVEDSYFLVRLHNAQAFFHAGFWAKPGYLIVSSTVSSTFQPGTPLKSLYQISTLQKNVPCQLGISVNLTDWLPARAADSLRIVIEYTVIQDSPLKSFFDQVGKLGLSSKLSLVRPDVGAALKASEVAGQLLSFVIGEGSEHKIFPLTIDLNLANLKAGYYAIVGSSTDQALPTVLTIDKNQQLTDPNDSSLQDYCYAILQVLALPRRGEEIARGEAWWELLQTGKEQALDAMPVDEQERRQALTDWKTTLKQVRELARKDCLFLLNEVQQIIQSAQTAVQAKLAPSTKGESAFSGEMPEEWQKLLGVQTGEEMDESVQDYQEALKRSKELLSAYKVD